VGVFSDHSVDHTLSYLIGATL